MPSRPISPSACCRCPSSLCRPRHDEPATAAATAGGRARRPQRTARPKAPAPRRPSATRRSRRPADTRNGRGGARRLLAEVAAVPNRRYLATAAAPPASKGPREGHRSRARSPARRGHGDVRGRRRAPADRRSASRGPGEHRSRPAAPGGAGGAAPAPPRPHRQRAAPAAAPAPADRAPRAEVRPAVATSGARRVAAGPPRSPTKPRRRRPGAPIAADGDFRIQLAAVRGEADAQRAWQLFMGDLGPALPTSSRSSSARTPPTACSIGCRSARSPARRRRRACASSSSSVMPAASSSAADRAPPSWAPLASRPSVTAAIVGVAGLVLDEDERAPDPAEQPLGLHPVRAQLREPGPGAISVDDLRAAVGRPDAPVLIDQEGGRVARLCPPHWPARPPARRLGLLAERDREAGIEAAWLHARLIAADLAPLGISVVCAPVLDLALPGRTRAIGDRALAADPRAGRGARAGHDRRVPRRRRPAGDQAPAGPRAGAPRQPPRSADRQRRARRDGAAPTGCRFAPAGRRRSR